MVVVPDLPATYRGANALAGRDAHIADIRRSAASFGRHGRGTGRVEVIAGVNLPMLIKLAGIRGENNMQKALTDSSEAGRKYINVASSVLASK